MKSRFSVLRFISWINTKWALSSRLPHRLYLLAAHRSTVTPRLRQAERNNSKDEHAFLCWKRTDVLVSIVFLILSRFFFSSSKTWCDLRFFSSPVLKQNIGRICNHYGCTLETWYATRPVDNLYWFKNMLVQEVASRHVRTSTIWQSALCVLFGIMQISYIYLRSSMHCKHICRNIHLVFQLCATVQLVSLDFTLCPSNDRSDSILVGQLHQQLSGSASANNQFLQPTALGHRRYCQLLRLWMEILGVLPTK